MIKKFSHKILKIDELYINPDNYRYIEAASDEMSAIISMFKVTNGKSENEMINLAIDIANDGLNPFEMPIVCFDDDLKKYVVYDGNRRLTCIKLMSQYKNNEIILAEIPLVSKIYKLVLDVSNGILCTVYDNVDDAKACLVKIHRDINEGIGRKQWDAQAKIKADAAMGNKNKTYAIIEFMRNNPNTDKKLLNDIVTKKWTSKLERVIGFSKFVDVYNISFDENSELIYVDSKEHVLKMLSHLINDLIYKSATGNFRLKKDFDNYVNDLDDEFKTLVKDKNIMEMKKEEIKNGQKSINDKRIIDKVKNTYEDNNILMQQTINMTEINDKQKNAQNNDSNRLIINTNKDSFKQKDISMQTDVKQDKNINDFATAEPRIISRKYKQEREALRLSKNYEERVYNCLNEKGKEFLMELEALNVKDFPVATSALCRCLLEYILKLWAKKLEITFDSSKLPSTYDRCLNTLRDKNIINNGEIKILKSQIDKEGYIALLNTWIHADSDACVSEVNLISIWKNIRILIEKYLEN